MVLQASYTARVEEEQKATSERKALENKAKQARNPETLDELKASYDRYKQDGGVKIIYRLKSSI